jgi:hypothetical protein
VSSLHRIHNPSAHRRHFVSSYEVQESVVGLVVGVAAPPVAVTPVSDGIEKYVASQAAGADAVIVASFVSVTMSVPEPATVRADVSVCELPLAPVAKFHVTSLVVLEQPVAAVVSVLFE